MAPKNLLTSRQLVIYEFIRDNILQRGYGPTVREIADEFGIRSPNGVVGHLQALEKKGLIIRDKKKSRAIELTPEAMEQERGLPMAGTVAAGMTSLAFEQDERVDFDGM
ncbi:MAG: repressor LexA, partial [Planctomycetota bacterium]|nr:repressor LexA [Planctomycetota bacterium]